jgi:hypothetical protein
MDPDELRKLEEEVRRLWVEIPLERRGSRHDIRRVDRRYVLDPCGEVQVLYCRDSYDERFIVLAFRHTPYYYGWGERGGLEDREAASIAREIAEPPHPTILSVYWAYRGGMGVRRVLAFSEWLGEAERRRPERVFVGIRGPGISWLGRPMTTGPGSGMAGFRSADIYLLRAGLRWI